ncbi:hypothetical protein [Legionella sp. km772]|uniref:hypothetical protein n=1 Tax=Legionella sp. km772 TaxID=2498111 RepID=UPI000F8C4124|nr:hypothetical protein [Legionella sp. km772]RUR13497.1 hypothetical protein ELY15_01995 [Legionella sp. km772]
MVILFPSYIRRIALKNTFFSSKNPRLYHSSDINDLIKKNHLKFEANILKAFSVKIDSTIIDDEIDFISNLRNSLFHYQGEFDTRIITDILKAFIFINILLPEKLCMANVLVQKEDFIALLKTDSLQFTGILANVNEIMVHKDNYFDINIGEDKICNECGYESLVSLESDKGHCYLCLLCSHHDFFQKCFDCGIEQPEEHMAHLDKDIFLCESCYDYKFH